MWTFAVCVLACGLVHGLAAASVQEKESKFWIENGKRMLDKKLKMQLQTNTAKNVIIFLGDGMSLTTLTAARIYQGQLHNASGENEHLSFEQFPFTGISKTYCVDFQVPDSACTATAYLCGVKTNKGAIGVSSKVPLSDCPASVPEDVRPTSIMQWAQWVGKATGIVTTTRVTHASPAGAYAHTAHRDWESDSDMKQLAQGKTNITQCEDIARQLITRDPGQNFKVILGGGRGNFLLKEVNSTGRRLDENLVNVWKNDKLNRFPGQAAKYATNREELMNTDTSKVDYLLGLFHNSHMDYRLKSDAQAQPTLQEMTRKAIEVLQKGPKGFVLFVEGGLIDKAHHHSWARIALDETVEFSKAVKVAAEMTSEDDTLIVVTSDHAHTMSMAGYPVRGENILGSPRSLADDGKTYTTLSYANGPRISFGTIDNDTVSCQRLNVTDEDIAKVDFDYPSLVQLNTETHGGDDVMVFARGPWAHLFTGNFEQNEIPLAMALAADLPMERPTSDSGRSGAAPRINSVVLITTSLLLCLLETIRFVL